MIRKAALYSLLACMALYIGALLAVDWLAKKIRGIMGEARWES